MPEPFEDVLVYFGDSAIAIAFMWNDGAWSSADIDEPFYECITHWMPLPEPPEER